jgi:hypothetical protein
MKREYFDLDDDEEIRDGETLRVPPPLFLMDAARRGYDLDLDDDDVEIPDGGSVRVPMMVLDAARDHQPHYVSDVASRSESLSDLRDAARSARRAWIQRISDAWRAPAGLVARPGQQQQTDPSQINRSALSHEPDSSSPAQWREHMRGPDDEPDHDAGAMMRGHLSTESSAGAQAKRDRAWAEYKDRLGSAWQRGRAPGAAFAERSIVGAGPRSMTVERIGKTDPGRAREIERQAESSQWRHGA